MKKKYFVSILILVLHYGLPLKLSAQPHLQIERNFEALRLDGNQAWLSFYDGAAYEGFLWNNQGNMTLGTSHLNPSGLLKFVTNNVERMIIDAAGYIKMGDQNGASMRLVVQANDLSYFNPAIFGRSENSDGVTGVSNNRVGVHGQSFSSTGVSGSGLVGVSGDGTVIGVSASGQNSDFNAQGPGIDYNSTSSRRWKTNIRNIDDPLIKIAALRGVYYSWDEDHGGQEDIGFIAEEVGEVLPEIVAYEENGIDAKGLDYSKMTPLLVEALNALQRELEKLRVEHNLAIQELKNRINQLERNSTHSRMD